MAKIYTFTDDDVVRLRNHMNIAMFPSYAPEENATKEEKEMSQRVTFQLDRWLNGIMR